MWKSPIRKKNRKRKTLTEGYKWFTNNHATVTGKPMAKGRKDVKSKKYYQTFCKKISPWNIIVKYIRKNQEIIIIIVKVILEGIVEIILQGTEMVSIKNAISSTYRLGTANFFCH